MSRRRYAPQLIFQPVVFVNRVNEARVMQFQHMTASHFAQKIFHHFGHASRVRRIVSIKCRVKTRQAFFGFYF